MARLARLVVPHQLHHVMQSGNDRQQMFREPSDYLLFLEWLSQSARQFKVAIHTYALLPNHLHLLATPSDENGLSRMMQWIGRYYVPYFNNKYGRTGTLWQGRFKATVIEPVQYFITCSRYIELNPVRAGIVAAAAEYRWSSYAHHVGTKADPVVIDHPLYWSLGNTPFDREAAYLRLMEQPLTADEIDVLNEATLKGWLLGSEKFKESIARQTARRISPGKRGRPKKADIALHAKPKV
jgi:putative transposase